MCVIPFILLLISITSFIVPNNDHINISCQLLRSVQFKITYTWSLSFCLSVCLFVVVVVVVAVVVVFLF